MSNLLDRSSIVLTPTAYNNGEALCIKPDDASGDFQFSRNSAATRVNAQGLVENVQILSSNLVQNPSFSEEGVQEVSNGSFSQEGVQLITNGDFTNNIDGWVSYSSVSTWDNGTIKTTATTNTAWIRQNSVVTANKYYKVTFKAKASNISQNIKIYNGSTFADTGLSFDEVDVYQEFTYYLYTTVTQIIIGQQSVSVGSTINFDNVSVREVGQDWEFNSTAILTSNGMNITTGGYIRQDVVTIGKSYKLTYDIVSYTSGDIRVYDGTSQGSIPTSVGSNTFNFTAGGSVFFIQSNSASVNLVITNISVKEVGQNWALVGDFEVNNQEAFITNASQYSQLTNQIGVNYLLSGKKYKLEADIGELSISGSLAYRYTGGAVTRIYTTDIIDGKYTAYFTMPQNGNFWFQTTNSYTGLNATITNISVIEITDDTNLPRINYENFSYQDALGSEEISNGSFDTDTKWTTYTGWTISGGSANCDGTQSGNTTLVQQNGIKGAIIDFVVGKTYKVNFDIVVTSGQISNIEVASGYDSNAITTSGNHTAYITAVSTNDRFTITANPSFIGSIDNVSVKEYLGQEVVPESGCGSWLWESQSTNLITYSSDYTQWNKSGSMVITSNNAISPDGTQNASLLTANAANQFIYLSASAAANSTISLYIKRKTGTGDIELSNNGGSSYTVLSVTDEWNRVQVTFAASTFQTVIKINTSGDEIYLWGVQLEALSYASSLIPTSGSQVTRNQDLCNNGGSLASINSTEGVLYAEISGFNLPQGYISISDGTWGNSIRIGIASETLIRVWVYVGNSTVISQFFTYDTSDMNKIAVKYSLTDFKVYINGSNVFSTSSVTFPIGTLSKLAFRRGDQYSPFFGKTKALAVWKEALSDQELTELTTI